MTAPQDPFRSPDEGSTPPGARPPHDAPPHGATGGSGPGGSSYGGYGGSGYGGPASSGPPARGARNGMGVAALVLGLLAVLTGLLIVGALPGIAAIVVGLVGRARVKRREADNGGMALAGIVLGLLGVLLSVLAIAGVASFLGSEEFSNLNECYADAGSDRAARESCEDEFRDQVR